MRRILVAGRGSSGSWIVRGEQLGAAIGAVVDPHCNSVKGYDLAVCVKRPRRDVLERLHHAGVPVVWDIVDAYPQPEGNLWKREMCLEWLREKVEEIKPVALVAATRTMASDCEEFKLPTLVLPHHARPFMSLNPIRPAVQVVGYEGGEQYINGFWRAAMEKECSSRGWHFLVNPPMLSDLDIVVAVRDCTGYAPRNWKSGVKLANAQGSGTPCVLNREQGCIDISNGAERWAETPDEMHNAINTLVTQEARRKAHAELVEHAPLLKDVAKRYREWLEAL